MSEFHARRRGQITDTAIFLGFLGGFLLAAPVGWTALTDGFVEGTIPSAIFRFSVTVLGGGAVGALIGLLVGRALGALWHRWFDRYRLAHPPIERPERQAPPPPVRREIAAAARFDRIRYEVGPLPSAPWLALLASESHDAAADGMAVDEALARTPSVAAWHDDRLVGAIRILTDGQRVATIADLLVHRDYRFRGIGRALVEQAIALAPEARLTVSAPRSAQSFFEQAGGERILVGFVIGRRAKP